MITDPNQFWDLFLSSRILPETKIRGLIEQYNSGNHPAEPSQQAAWLVEKKTLSDYQAAVLLSGHDGPFRYGNYNVNGRFEKGQLGPLFKAIHVTTGHPVLLEFFPGFTDNDLAIWHLAESIVEQASQIDAVNLIRIHETVIQPHHRCVASEYPAGALMYDKLPRKARLPWAKACVLFTQVARGLGELHKHGIIHGAISPRAIWFQKSSLTQLRLGLQADTAFESPEPGVKDPECKFDYLPPECEPETGKPAVRLVSESNAPGASLGGGTIPGDIYSLGCILVRAIGGRVPYPAASPQEIRERHANDPLPTLAKYDLLPELLGLIHQMLAKNPAERPTDLGAISDKLAEFADESVDAIKADVPPTRAAYLTNLHQFAPGSQPAMQETISVDTESLPVISAIDFSSKNVDSQGEKANGFSKLNPPSTASDRAVASARKRKKNKWKVPTAIASSLILLSAVIGIWAYQANQTKLPTAQVASTDDTENPSMGAGEQTLSTPKSEPLSGTPISAMPESERPTLIQQLIADDQESLWQTPTTGAPIDFSGLPPAAKLIFVFRPAEFLSQPEGPRVLEGMGPRFQSLVDRFTQYSGLVLEDIEQVIISLHSTPELNYEPFFVITTTQPLEQERLVQLWNRPVPTKNEIGQEFLISGDTGYYFLDDSRDTAANRPPNRVSKFAIGSKKRIEEVAATAGANTLTGSLKTIANWTDAQRHVNVLYLRPALFNDEGQKFMGENLKKFNRELSIVIPDAVRGGLLSLHLDNGTYLEMMFDRTLDLKAIDLADLLSRQMRTQRDQLTQFVASIPPSPYWDKVRLKYDNMLNDLIRNLRWNVEHGEVAANVWLPPMAAHNLIAASELVMTFSGGSSAAPATAQPKGPQTMSELLATKRDLDVANPPDLNLLMSDIESAVKEDYPGLPFEFHIRLQGSDLKKEGITQNQRPGALDIHQKSLADILTQIMVAANPSKDISGPADPNCKLVWVVADDPEKAGQSAVLITTRAAAIQKKYKLPDEFQPKKD